MDDDPITRLIYTALADYPFCRYHGDWRYSFREINGVRLSLLINLQRSDDRFKCILGPGQVFRLSWDRQVGIRYAKWVGTPPSDADRVEFMLRVDSDL